VRRKKFPILVYDASCHLSCIPQRMRLSDTVMEIHVWRLEDNGVTILTFWGHVTSSVT